MKNFPEIPAWYPLKMKKRRFRNGMFFILTGGLFFVIFSFFSTKYDPLNFFSPIVLGEEYKNELIVSSFEQEGSKGPTSLVEENTERKKPENFIPIGVPLPRIKNGIADFVSVSSHASLVIDAESETILHYNEGKERRPIASLTKMMTALMVMENIKDLDEVVTIKKEMLSVEGTVVGCPRSGYCTSTRLQVNEEIRVKDLLKAMLMNSANDSATALAVHIGGTTEDFVRDMNVRAKSLGFMDSNFCTPSGLEIEGGECYSTAYDIARIAIKLLEYEEVWNIMNLPPGTAIASVDGKYTHELLNTNALLGSYDGLLGAKTGFTPDAGYCVLAVAQKQGHTIIGVTLDDPYRWRTIQDMFTWTFSSYIWE